MGERAIERFVDGLVDTRDFEFETTTGAARANR